MTGNFAIDPGRIEPSSAMAASDALFWYAESAVPHLRAVVGGLYVLDRPPERARIERSYDLALARMPRLRQRVMEPPLGLGLPRWADDEHFDRSYHFRHLSVRDPGGMRELLELAGTLLATPLDRERPLWETYWIDGLEGGRAAVFFKLHHSIVDGVGALALLASFTQNSRREAMPNVGVGDHPAIRAHPQSSAGEIIGLVTGGAREGAALVRRALEAAAGAIVRPTQCIASASSLVRSVRGLASDFGKPAVYDPLTRKASGLSRRLDVDEIPLERFHRISEALGVTINDVVLTALAGALGVYHRARGVPVETLNCMVPVNLRSREERWALGNRVGMLNVVLPLAETRPKKRLDLIVAQTAAGKNDRRGATSALLIRAIALVPIFMLRWFAYQTVQRLNVVCTNIPGVRDRRYIAGAEVQAMYPFVSVIEGMPLMMALLSYAGMMNIGIDSDPEAIPDPERVTQLFERSLRELERLARRAGGAKPSTAVAVETSC